MSNRVTTISCPDSIQQAAADDALAVQNACNLIAVVGAFHRQLKALHQHGVYGDDLNNHPVALAFVSKLHSLCRMSLDRESAAFDALDHLQRGETAEYEVIPL